MVGCTNSEAVVFEPCSASTSGWRRRGAIADFLPGLCKRGGLAGAAPQDGYAVRVGLDETVTARGVAGGLLHVTVLVALGRLAESGAITFQQQMPRGHCP